MAVLESCANLQQREHATRALRRESTWPFSFSNSASSSIIKSRSAASEMRPARIRVALILSAQLDVLDTNLDTLLKIIAPFFFCSFVMNTQTLNTSLVEMLVEMVFLVSGVVKTVFRLSKKITDFFVFHHEQKEVKQDFVVISKSPLFPHGNADNMFYNFVVLFFSP